MHMFFLKLPLKGPEGRGRRVSVGGALTTILCQYFVRCENCQILGFSLRVEVFVRVLSDLSSGGIRTSVGIRTSPAGVRTPRGGGIGTPRSGGAGMPRPG